MRSKFLEQHWPSSQRLPQRTQALHRLWWDGSQKEGEVVIGAEVAVVSNDELVLVGQGHFLVVSCSQCTLEGGEGTVGEVLRAGDKVILSADARDIVKDSGGHLCCRGRSQLRLLVPVNGEVSGGWSEAVEKARLWQGFISCVRSYFVDRGFLEVNTPSLNASPGGESNLDPFITELKWGDYRRAVYLPTSPELNLKKLLSVGFTDIFEICKCFRNEESGEHHEPEFWMLEYYMAYAGWREILSVFVGLLERLKESHLIIGECGDVEEVTMTQVFKKHLGFALTPSTSLLELQSLARSKGLAPLSDWSDMFHLLFLTFVESKLGVSSPTVVTHFPPQQAALANIDQQGWAQRFEIYWRGLEIGNAYDELIGAEENRQRFDDENLRRHRAGKSSVPADKNFFSALERGIPPCGGIAIGLDRLLMAAQNKDSIKEVQLFSTQELLNRD